MSVMCKKQNFLSQELEESLTSASIQHRLTSITGRPLDRVALHATTMLAAGIFWLSPHPPMLDIPQHAGQVALLLDLLSDNPHWQDIFYINYFTPYLLGYGLWALLALIMPLGIALKILLMATFWGFVYSGCYLRKRCQADDRLDWLLLLAFFGFAFSWGFLTFLMAAALAMLYLAHVMQYSKAPDARTAIWLCIAGLALFFCHGLVFLLCMALGGLFAIGHARSFWGLVRRVLPYLVCAPLAITYYISASSNPVTQESFSLEILWRWDINRVVQFFILPVSGNATLMALVVGLLAMLAPYLIGSRQRFHDMNWLPFAFIVVIWVCVPQFAMKTSMLYHRFSLFTLPFYILLFKRPEPVNTDSSKGRHAIALLASWLLPLMTIAYLCLTATQFMVFAKESADFDHATQHVPDGQKVLSLPFDANSLATGDSQAYLHYASWYQAEHKGLVDFSFAWYMPQPVRFKIGMQPKVKPIFTNRPWLLSELSDVGSRYDYFFVRSSGRPAKRLANRDECVIQHQTSAGKWHIYRRVSCPPSARL